MVRINIVEVRVEGDDVTDEATAKGVKLAATEVERGSTAGRKTFSMDSSSSDKNLTTIWTVKPQS